MNTRFTAWLGRTTSALFAAALLSLLTTSAHAQSQVASAVFPPNADFESTSIAGAPPDSWRMTQGTWGLSATLDSDAYTGGNAVRLLAASDASQAPRLTSQRMDVRGGERYVVDFAVKRLGYSGAPVFASVRFYADMSNTIVYADSALITPTANAWVRGHAVVIAPANARYAEINIGSATASDDVLVDGVDFARASFPQQAWTVVSDNAMFQNGWTNWGNGFGSVGFRINSLGNLEFKGVAKSPTTAPAAYSVLFTLPSGYCPAERHMVRVNALGTGPTDLEINADCTVKIETITSNSFVSFDSISVPMN